MNEHDFDKSLFRKMRESMKPGDDVKAELYRKIDSLENYREPTVKTSKPPFKFLNWVPLTAMACILVVAGVLIYPHVSREANYVPDDIIETPAAAFTEVTPEIYEGVPQSTADLDGIYYGEDAYAGKRKLLPVPSPETEEELKTAYALYSSARYGMEITADEIIILEYYGSYNGYHAAIMHIYDWGIATSLVEVYAAGYPFHFSGDLMIHVMYYGELVNIRTAFERGLLNYNDVSDIWLLYNGGELIEMDTPPEWEPDAPVPTPSERPQPETPQPETPQPETPRPERPQPETPVPTPTPPVTIPAPVPTPEPEPIPFYPSTNPNVRGNIAGNINNRGIAAMQDGWIYYTSNTDNNSLYKIRTDGTERTKLNSERSLQINVVGDWVYYADDNIDDSGRNNGSVHKIRTDGTQRTWLFDGRTSFMTVTSDWIYYATDNGLYRIRTDGTGMTMLHSTRVFYINVVGDWIYYSEGDTAHLYKIRTDGTGRTQLNFDISHNINVDGDWIYYENHDIYTEDGTTMIYKIRTDGTGKTRVMQDRYAANLVISDGWMYYNLYSLDNNGHFLDDAGFYKARLDGTGRTMVTNQMLYLPGVVGDWIYFRVVDFYKIRTDGTEYQRLD
jgi:hypothetical protein